MATQVIYDLLKYSRSYPSEDPARFSTQPTSYDTEWQHFSNAKLQLCLDDASSEGYFRSAKVTILWVPVGSSLQLETAVFLEDLDLRSFSPVSTAPKKAQPQSPPLKVVYRDSVVGFRYLHPRVIPAGAHPAYRRFQICFKDPLLASQFVDSIRRFCPCKASLLSTSVPAQTTAVMAHISAAPGMSTPANNKYTAIESFPVASHQHSSRALNPSTSVLVNDLQNQPHSMQPPTLFPAKVQAMQHNADKSGLPLCGTTTDPFNTTATSHMSSSLLVSQKTDIPSLSSTSTVACSPRRPDNVTEHQDPSHHTHLTCTTTAVSVGINDSSTSSKHSTQGSTTSSVRTRAETASTINMTLSNHPKDKAPNHNMDEISIVSPQALIPPDCLKDLCTIKELCALSMDQLEHLVGEVIREPEFLPLLEKLDGMWKVKGFITRTSKECKP